MHLHFSPGDALEGKIFVNYRRDDSRADAARVHDRLVQTFGAANVFMDVDNLLIGQRFDKVLAKALNQCDVFLAVIGPRWMEQLRARQHTGDWDYVREEIAAALKRDTLAIPVLIERTPLPRADQLPEDIRTLVMYQKHDIMHESFGRDVTALIEGIKAARQAAAERPDVPWGIFASVMIAIAVLAAALYFGPPLSSLISQKPEAVASIRTATVATAPASNTPTADIADVQRWSEVAQRKAAEVAVDASAKEEAEREAASAAAKVKADEERRLAVQAVAEENNRAEAEAKTKTFTKPGDTFKDCPDECPEMVVLPAGSFRMGSPASEFGRDRDEGPQHTVMIMKPFAAGKREVTRDQFAAFAAASRYKVGDRCWTFDGNTFEERSGRSYLNPGYEQDGTHPVVCVSWDDAQAYVAWLSMKTAKPYRMLSEAEWEYAARSGSASRNSFGDVSEQQCKFANGADETAKASGLPKDWKYATCKDGYARTAPAGSFKPNAFGLYDMHGNVHEWCADAWHPNYQGAPADGAAWLGADTSSSILRGGSWELSPRDLRSAVRLKCQRGIRRSNVGFRVARTLG
jgi:formylglycine-generating enzyme required for sulfatase activity